MKVIFAVLILLLIVLLYENINEKEEFTSLNIINETGGNIKFKLLRGDCDNIVLEGHIPKWASSKLILIDGEKYYIMINEILHYIGIAKDGLIDINIDDMEIIRQSLHELN